MKKVQFKTVINAPREKVWDMLLGEDTYPQWTSVFAEGSTAETDWAKGSKVLFTDGKGNGMVSRIADNIPNEYMSIEHLGEVTGGVEDTESAKVKEWAGAYENYTLTSTGENKTEMTVDMDVTDDFEEMMKKMWPQALAKLKEISER